ncbi:MAG: ATP-binding protein [Jaaginema sp. PMC 1079.18]|nr:ATP-binding protein [Jaaginema sp. PMC 1080.18]MEC4851465.1 ATP-binding protein [Jaaginema sp. PMC 1079.18]MEC4867012.1 ATP-binding protein [Jaaginema sp. PMC 1078.18]
MSDYHELTRLDEVLITEALSRRTPRPPNLQAENEAMRSLVRQLVQQSEAILQHLVELAVELCDLGNTGTVGISLVETQPDGETVWRWVAIAGTLATPREPYPLEQYNPASVCLEQAAPVLFSYPERYFSDLPLDNQPWVEALIVPLLTPEQALGAIWIITHSKQRQFDSEDARLIASLADITAAAIRQNQHQTGEQQAISTALAVEVAERQLGEINEISVVSYDISDRKRREANLTFLADLMNDLSSLTTAKEVMEMAGKRITEYLDLSRYMFVEIFPEAGTCTYLLPSHPPGQLEISGSFVLAEYHTEAEHRLLCAGHSMIVNDIRDGTRTPEQIAAFKMFDIASIVNTPYLSNGRWVFDLGVARSQPSVWREDEIELLRELSARVWLRIERARAEAALRKSEAKYRSLFNSIDEGFLIAEVIYDSSGQAVDILYLEGNPAASHLTGVPDYTQQRLREIAPDFESYWFEIYDRVARTGVSERTEQYAAPLNRWYDFYVFPIEGAELGQSRRVAVIFQDISDRKRREAHQAFLAEIALLFSEALSAEAVIQRVGAKLGDYLQIAGCNFCEIDLAQDRIVYLGRWHQDNTIQLPNRLRLSEQISSDFLQQIYLGEPIVSHNTQTNSITNASANESIGVQAFITVPFFREGEWQYLFSIHDNKPRVWQADEIELVSEVANRTFPRIDRARTEAAMRELELQRIQEQAARAQEQQRAEALAELNRAKTLFFSNISHEFRTPLTLLLGPLADAIANLESSPNSLDAGTLPQLNLAYRNALRLLKLVNTLLDFSRVEADRLQATYEPTDLAAYTADLASMFRSTVETAGLRFEVDCPPLPQWVAVDREMWEKIVLNLLSNAFKFTFEGEIRISLRVGEDADSTQTPVAILEVQDTGIGIPENELPHIFERFYQSKSDRGRSYEGSGIGLALVQELVQLHEGTVTAHSTLGVGTRFTVMLPMQERSRLGDSASPGSPIPTQMNAFVAEAQSWLSQADSELLRSEEAQPPETVSQGDRRLPHILLVEDNADMRSYLKVLLAAYYQVTTAHDGVAAWRIISEAIERDDLGYALVLTDVMMPGLNGIELLRSLRDNPKTREIPVILLSARTGEEAEIAGLEANADDYLFKPFSARQLLARIEANLKLARMRREAVYREQVMAEVQNLNATLEQRVQMRTAQLEAINQELEAFSYSVSHDLQTPLRYISSFVERLQNHLSSAPIDATTQRYLGILEQATARSYQMVNDLLQFSRLGKTQLSFRPVAMTQLVQEVRSQLEPSIGDRAIQWQIEPLPEVQGDREMLRLVWQNLLTNAVKYTREQSIARITIGSIIENHTITFWIRDNGVGFDLKYQDRLFGLFQRLHSQEQFPGTGVGLANVRRIIHCHDGRIWAEGAIDCGATFYFSLPKREIFL